MNFLMQPWHLLVLVLASWKNREQQQVIDYLHTRVHFLLVNVCPKIDLLLDHNRLQNLSLSVICVFTLLIRREHVAEHFFIIQATCFVSRMSIIPHAIMPKNHHMTKNVLLDQSSLTMKFFYAFRVKFMWLAVQSSCTLPEQSIININPDKAFDIKLFDESVKDENSYFFPVMVKNELINHISEINLSGSIVGFATIST
ncbi:MAG: hypothetical protein R3C11_24500 [Planctomycetaceae bacterium]